LLLLGVANESDMNDEILAMAGIDNAHNLAREMSVVRLMALAERAVGLISVDTGPAHVAAALGCPVLVLFDSPAKRAMYAPRGPGAPTHCIVGGTDARPSMFDITPEAVLTAWQGMDLSRRSAMAATELARTTTRSANAQAGHGDSTMNKFGRRGN
jgi:heptosyltransferase-2/heptosyltransferase-3